VSTRTVYFIVAVAFFVLALIAIALYYYRRSQKSSQKNWERLLKRLTAVDRSSIAEVALDIIDESGQKRQDEASAVLEPSQIWKLVGGLKGLEVIEANCAFLVDLPLLLPNSCASAPGRSSGRWEDLRALRKPESSRVLSRCMRSPRLRPII
jgi:hypothetical protein